MRIESVRKGASGTATIVAGGSSFLVDLEQLEELGLASSSLVAGTVLDESAEASLRLAAEAREAEKRGLSLLSRAEQSAFLLRGKLEIRGFSPQAVRLALGRLSEQGYLDDRRFATAYAASRLSRRAEGPASLAVALRARGVDEKTAKAAIADLLGPEERRIALAKAWARELKRCGGDRGMARARLRVLGFSSSEIGDFLESAE
jgi:regulatory protein